MKNVLVLIIFLVLTITGTIYLSKHIPKRFSQEHLESLGLIKSNK